MLAEGAHGPLFLAHQILKLAVIMKKLVAHTFGIQDTALELHRLVDFFEDRLRLNQKLFVLSASWHHRHSNLRIADRMLRWRDAGYPGPRSYVGDRGLKLVGSFFNRRRLDCFGFLLQVHFLFKHCGFEFEERGFDGIDVGALLHIQ